MHDSMFWWLWQLLVLHQYECVEEASRTVRMLYLVMFAEVVCIT